MKFVTKKPVSWIFVLDPIKASNRKVLKLPELYEKHGD